MSEINPYEAPQSVAKDLPLAEAAPLYPAWNTRAINIQMLAIVMAVVFGFSTAITSLEKVFVFLAISLGVVIEILAIVLTWTAIRHRVTWLLVSELTLLLPLVIGIMAWIKHSFSG